MRCFSTYKTRSRGILLTFCLLLFALPLNACPLCIEAISKVGGLAKGFYWSILLMLGVPALVVALISGYILTAYRRSR